jgi:hypothetical protein
MDDERYNDTAFVYFLLAFLTLALIPWTWFMVKREDYNRFSWCCSLLLVFPRDAGQG